MDPRKKLEKYIVSAGGYATAADTLGCSESTLRSVGNGWRGVSSRMAEQWEKASRGKLPFSEMARIVAIKQPTGELAIAPRGAAKRKARKPRARVRK